jgi:hypothetical protein
VNQQQLPILLEGIVRLSGKDAFDKIQLNDLENEQLSIQLLSKELPLFRKFMKLHLESFAFAGQHAIEWSKSDQACIAMACRVFNHLMAAAKLLVTGYWAESTVIERSAFEAITREWYFYKYPKKATSWFRGGMKGEVRQCTVRKALGDIEGEETRQVLGTHYSYLCQHVHPNIEAIQLQTWDGENAIGRKAFLGGYVCTGNISGTRAKAIEIQFQSLLLVTMTATAMLRIIGLHDATDTWKQEYHDLSQETIRLLKEREIV